MKYTVEQILNAMVAGKDISINDNPAVKKNYVNPTAATLMLMAGANEITKYGMPISKAIGDFTGANAYLQDLVTYNRNDLITGAKAKETLDLIFDKSEFLKRVTTKTGDELTYPIDMEAATEENLISTLRAGAQPTTVTKKFGIIGKECFARHCEFQIDLSMTEIRNNLYNPSFESNLEAKIGTEISNDMLRLATNGVADDYSGVAAGEMGIGSYMYALGIGWEYLLQTLNGSWTNSNQQSIVIGKFGNKVTPNKVEIAATGATSIFSRAFATALEGFVAGNANSTVSVDATSMKVLAGAGATGSWAEHPAIECTPNVTAVLTYTITISGGTQVAYIEILDQANNVIACTPVTSATVTASTLSFNTGNNKWLKMRCQQDTASVYVHFDNLDITETRTTYDGNDIIDLMDKLIDVTPDQYRIPGKAQFAMSLTDIVKYSRAKGSPVQIVDGLAVGVNTEAREAWRVKGSIPAHEGYEVVYNPMKFDIGTSKSLGDIGGTPVSLYGSIIFGNLKELWLYGQNKIEKYREYKPRLSGGGSGFEIGQHFWIDPQVGNAEALSVAFYGATVETPVLMQTNAIKSTECVSATTTAAAGFAAYCDTKDARIFATLTANVADIATLELAVAGVTAGDVFEVTPGVMEGSATGQSFLTAAAWSFRAFKDGYLAMSALKACTFA